MVILYCILAAATGTGLGWWLRDRQTADPIRKHPRGMEESDPYRLCESVFTTPESNFYRTLQETLPMGYRLLAKVRLADVLNVSYGAGDRGEAHARVNGKCLDFVICDTAMRPVLAILLGEAEDRRAREFVERVCGKIGLRIERVAAQPSYPAAQVRQVIECLDDQIAA